MSIYRIELRLIKGDEAIAEKRFAELRDIIKMVEPGQYTAPPGEILNSVSPTEGAWTFDFDSGNADESSSDEGVIGCLRSFVAKRGENL